MKVNRKPTHAVLTSILANPSDARVLAALGLIHLVFAVLGFSGWRCPIFLATGVPCPGCGLSRATAALLQGDLKTMAKNHLFAPAVLFFLGITGVIAVLPEKPRGVLLKQIEQIEIQTKFTLFIIISLLLYWGLRLILNPVDYTELIKTLY